MLPRDMSRRRYEANLIELQERMTAYARENGIEVADPAPDTVRLSHSLYLAHSTASDDFSKICAAGRLLSATQLALRGGKASKPGSVKVLLGTADSVFFYVAPFRYPNTGCGLLFARSLEEHRMDDGVATPFDSGGLVHVLVRPNPAEPVRDFLSRHELPIPDYREYLRISLATLFDKPVDYIEGSQPRWSGPIGLMGGDRRRWTHEVRIPREVWIRTGDLQAVFAPISRVASDPEIGRLFEWCKSEGRDRISFNTARGDDFEALRRECVKYIYSKLQ
ncbi:MAG: hypothetical protein Q8N47_25615 [Bryobacterales bacterium]|nr:hypothetical protein [Bryobacterales bacterium]